MSELAEALDAATATNPTPAPTATAVSEQPDKAPTTPDDAKSEDYRGAGSKDALKADLARERDKRQALEQRVNQLTEGLTRALGISPDQDKPLTAEQLTAQLDTAQAETRNLKAQIAVYTATPDGVDARALLDSRAFLDSITGIDPSDRDAISAAITKHVEANPRFKTRTGSSGDLYTRGTTNPDPGTGVNRIAAALNRT